MNSYINFEGLGIRHQEELSLKRFIPPEILAKGFEAKEYQIHTFTISPGVDPYTTPLTAAQQPAEQGKEVQRLRLFRTGLEPRRLLQTAFATLPKNAQVVGQRARSQILPTSAAREKESSLNRSLVGAVPPASTPKLLVSLCSANSPRKRLRSSPRASRRTARSTKTTTR